MENSIKLCSICKEKEFKYKCPGCLMTTCSLECVNIHKLEFDCDGKQMIPFKKLEDIDDKQFFKGKICIYVSYILLLPMINYLILFLFSKFHPSDFGFIEEGSRLLDCYIRDRKNIVKSKAHIPPWLARLVWEARYRGTRLKILPAGFEKRIKNKTCFICNKKIIEWDVGFIFTHITEKGTVIEKPSSLVLKRVAESKTLKEILTGVLNPKDVLERLDIWKLLTSYRLADESKILILLFSGKQFYEIGSGQSLTKALEGKTIIEYPTFIVTFNEFKDKFPIVQFDETNDVINAFADKDFFGNKYGRRKYRKTKRKRSEGFKSHIEPKVAKIVSSEGNPISLDRCVVPCVVPCVESVVASVIESLVDSVVESVEPHVEQPVEPHVEQPVESNSVPILSQNISDVSSLSASDDEDYQKFLNIGFAHQSTGV